MTTDTQLAWMYRPDYPGAPHPSDLKEFFGIPPSPDTEEQLDANIREKRKLWRGKSNKSRNKEARTLAEAVLAAIAEAEDAIKRGTSVDGARAATSRPDGAVEGRPLTLDDAWRQIELLLYRGRHEDALRAVTALTDRFHDQVKFHDLRAMVVLEVAQHSTQIAIGPDLLRLAVSDAEMVLSERKPDEVHYTTLIELLEVSGRNDEADAAYERAVRELPMTSAEFRVRRLRMLCRAPEWPAVLRLAVELVTARPDDRALRSEIVQLLVRRGVELLLPLEDEHEVVMYRCIVDTAAWVADGVPEAEDFVRPHRMWAANADQPIFAGDWQWRAFWGLITGFVALPILNATQSQPAWRIIDVGPAAAQGLTSARAIKKADRAWFLATMNAYLEAAHRDVKLRWQEHANEWPDLDIAFET